MHSLSQGVMQMICQWQALIRLVPHGMRSDVDRLGKNELQELRLRIGQPPLLVLKNGPVSLQSVVTRDDLAFVLNAASQYSPWSSETINRGYITARGGHRIGICGECTVHNGCVIGIRRPVSLCIRVARDFPGIAATAARYSGSLLIIGPPGSGKTTLLRDLIRQRSSYQKGSIGVVDERGELFPNTEGTSCFSSGSNTDILTGCSKQQGIDMILRTMGPSCIAVDEITEEADCQALIRTAWSGVDLLATAHAASLEELSTRPVYKLLMQYNIFRMVLVLHSDKTWTAERSSV